MIELVPVPGGKRGQTRVYVNGVFAGDWDSEEKAAAHGNKLLADRSETLLHAAVRTGYSTAFLTRILRAREVPRSLTGGRRYQLDPRAVDMAVKAWLKRETEVQAAGRLGVSITSLRTWKKEAGYGRHAALTPQEHDRLVDVYGGPPQTVQTWLERRSA
jgi:hypothetical protein